MWIAAKDVPKALEGKRAWIFTRWDRSVDMGWIARDYSRDERHCEGIYVWPIEAPEPPDLPDTKAK